MNNRWVALAIICIAFLQCTLNWFNIIPTFGELIPEMKLGYPELGLLVGMFVAGYGLAHIPAGILSEAYGLRTAILVGIAIQTAGTVISAKAGGYEMLLVGRFIGGVGASIYVGGTFGLIAAWFRGRELTTANGILAGIAYIGGALLGLYVWIDVVTAVGWRDALMLGAIASAVTFVALLFFYPSPGRIGNHVSISKKLNIDSLKRVLSNAKLWIVGFSFLGGYGAYLTAAQLLPQYAQEHLNVDAHQASLLGAVLLVSGAVGGPIGGRLADRYFGMTTTFAGACIVQSIGLFLIPYLTFDGLLVVTAVIGASHIVAFSAWISLPGSYREEIDISDIATACGLLLTIGAIGGFAVPVIYGWIMSSAGPVMAWLVVASISLAMTFICLFVAQRNAVIPEAEAPADV